MTSLAQPVSAARSTAFQARALYPVKAQAVGSQAYACYRPEWAGESLGGALTVAARR